ncbi:rhomboid family intramembrane serine protease [Hahella sp. CCB-MM4]|uniref:rhomboid family intramembrane serine protease n=1 Tax=Hahella sp. (strain CCB-MM4) TaxID=1926491 RepID=UPI000B9A63E2|nr:rhomboid family intramembrane serine protease [Hahella sp. CCB-MM4]OZG73482.1 rhomboid family intramembrane serine protease [Hahella sp. CCB-MM4]
MLILPAEHKLNWQRPPVITLALIIINVFVFFRLDATDTRLYNDAYDHYVNDRLYVMEAQEYADYLQRQVNLGLDDRFDLAAEVQQAVTDNNTEELIPLMLTDRGFVSYLTDKGPEFLEPEVYNDWLPKRQYIQLNFLDKLSYWQMGLIPADIELGDLLSYQFLHGDIGHLAGNMVILFLLGFAIERILGKALYILAYLFTGACGGLLFAAVEGNSLQPLIGASAAISGLMGMYVSYYRLRKIRFFYFVFFYFNYFKAPALLLLPLWLGLEIYHFFYDSLSHVAYMAHAGGLIAGAAIMIPWAKWYQPDSEDSHSHDEADLEFRTQLSKGFKAINKVDFDEARSIFLRLHEHNPHHSDIIRQLFHLYKIHPKDPDSQRFTQLALEDALTFNRIDEAIAIFEEYNRYASGCPLSDTSYYFRLLNGCLSTNRMSEAEKLLDTIGKSVKDKGLISEGFRSAIQAFNAREMPMKAKKYEKVLENLLTTSGPDTV